MYIFTFAEKLNNLDADDEKMNDHIKRETHGMNSRKIYEYFQSHPKEL